MKRLNQELSPFKDDELRDEKFIRQMWQEYKKWDHYQKSTTPRQAKLETAKVVSYLRTMNDGADSQDAINLNKWA